MCQFWHMSGKICARLVTCGQKTHRQKFHPLEVVKQAVCPHGHERILKGARSEAFGMERNIIVIFRRVRG